MTLFFSKDAKRPMLAPSFWEEPTNTCLIKFKGKYYYRYRSIHDSICVAKRTLESGKVVAGGGAVDIALSIHLDKFCRTFQSKEQIAISEFS